MAMRMGVLGGAREGLCGALPGAWTGENAGEVGVGGAGTLTLVNHAPDGGPARARVSGKIEPGD